MRDSARGERESYREFLPKKRRNILFQKSEKPIDKIVGRGYNRSSPSGRNTDGKG
jgi:hypothetical protein